MEWDMDYIRNLLKKLYPDSEKNSSYEWKAFAEGLIFHVDPLVEIKRIKQDR